MMRLLLGFECNIIISYTHYSLVVCRGLQNVHHQQGLQYAAIAGVYSEAN